MVPLSGGVDVEELFDFKAAHIVSDLHLGGDEGFQIFGQGKRFENFVNRLAASTDGPVVLVINGDMVDFLAEPQATYFDAGSALTKLRRIANDPSFAPVFTALQNFVKQRDHLLAITLGNHDLELAVPSVREFLLRTLSGGDAEARGRIILSFEGAGFRCRVGDASVLCLHGNEVDSWNVTDYETLRRMCRDHWTQPAGAARKWIPSAGTQLVIDVMNGMKQRYRWIDLLKPEDDAVPDVLMAVDGGQELSISRVVDGVSSFARKLKDAGKMYFNFLGEDEEVEETVRPRARQSVPAIGAQDEGTKALLWEAEQRFQRKEDPYLTVTGDQAGEYLTVRSLARQLFRRGRGDDPNDALREGLRDLRKDRSFLTSDRDVTANKMDDLVGSEIDFLVTGHTHLRRALRRKRGTGHYYNSGTWAWLMRIEAEVLDDPKRFSALVDTLCRTGANALSDSGFLRREPTVVSIFMDGGRTFAELRDVTEDGDTQPVRDTQFQKG